VIVGTWDIIYARLDRLKALRTEAAELAAAWEAESGYDSFAADQAETMRKHVAMVDHEIEISEAELRGFEAVALSEHEQAPWDE
jgi:hypothetical protein